MIVLWTILFLLLIFHVFTRYSRKGRLYNKIPGPKGIPLFGNLWQIMQCDKQEIWHLNREINRTYYPVSCWWGLNQGIVNVYHPDDLEVLLSSQKAIEKGHPYRYIAPWLKTGLLTSTGDKWRQRRKILMPAFHFSILKKYMEVTNEQGQKMIELLKEEGSTSVKSLLPFFKYCTLESTMGVPFNNLDTRETSQYEQSIIDMANITLYRFLRPYIIDCVFPYVPKLGALQKRTIEILHGFTNKLIQLRKEYHKNNDNKLLNEYNESNDLIYDDSQVGTKKKLAMLDLLLAAEKNGLIDQVGIQEEVDTFVFAGHDTISTAMTFTILLLAENKEVLVTFGFLINVKINTLMQNLTAFYDRAREEVTAIMDAVNGKAGVVEIEKFNYLERCIKESVRLFPPAPSLVRYIREDLQLKHALVSAGTQIFVHLWETHRDPNYWPEPEKFDPDRFLPENSTSRHPFSYVPFSAGPRNCIGQKFAMMQLKSLVARILYDFYLEPIEHTADIAMGLHFVMSPINPVHVKFVKINK